MTKKVLITGVSGMDGSTMADYLLKNTDHLVFGMVRRSAKPDYSNLSEALKNPRFKLVIGDLSDSQSIDGLVSDVKPDYLINLAAQSFVGSSWSLPEHTFDVDAVGVLRCLEAIRKHAPHCRFYNAGSSEEFGDVQTVPQNESHPLRARSPYGAAKIAARQLVKVYRESYGLYAVQGQLFNHEGERRGEEFVTRKISIGVAKIHHAIRNKKPHETILLGNLDAKRDWSHAEDFVDGIWRMVNQEDYNTSLERLKPNGSILLPGAWEKDYTRRLSKGVKEYVLSSNETHSVREFIEVAFNVAGMRGEWRGKALEEQYVLLGVDTQHLPVFPNEWVFSGAALVAIDEAFFRPAEVEILHGDSSLARKDLGWEPKIKFGELVERMVRNDIALLSNRV